MAYPSLLSRVMRTGERLLRPARTFARAKDGAAAVEMALIATPFFLLMFGIIELALVFLVSSTLENATTEAARTIRTGQLQQGGTATQASFKNTICTDFGWLAADCANNLFVDVRTYPTFAAAAVAPTPVVNNVFNPAVFGFSPGSPSSIVVVRSYYQWTLFNPLMMQSMQQVNGGKMLITATTAFRNEPYGGIG